VGENSESPTINFPIKLRDLLVGAAALGVGGAGFFGLDQLKGGEAKGAQAQSQPSTDPVFKLEVERNFKDVEERLGEIDGDLNSIRKAQREQGDTLRAIKCVVTEYEEPGCAVMKPRKRTGP